MKHFSQFNLALKMVKKTNLKLKTNLSIFKFGEVYYTSFLYVKQIGCLVVIENVRYLLISFFIAT